MSRGLGKIEKAIIEFLKEHKNCKEFEDIKVENNRLGSYEVDKNDTWISIKDLSNSLLESDFYGKDRAMLLDSEYKSLLRSVKSIEKKGIIEWCVWSLDGKELYKNGFGKGGRVYEKKMRLIKC